MSKRPNHVTNRRTLLAGALLGAAAAVPPPGFAAADLPPPFYSQGGQFIMVRPRRRAPSRATGTAGGGLIDFAALAGRIVIVNFWATWCAACARELPSLDRLAARLRDRPAVVLPIALDVRRAADVTEFYAAHGVTHLPVYIDPDRQVGRLGRDAEERDPFPLFALPTTYLIDPRGFVAGYVPGAAAWDSAPAGALLAWLAAQ